MSSGPALEAHQGIMDREILGDGIKLGAVGRHRTGMPRILHSGRESGRPGGGAASPNLLEGGCWSGSAVFGWVGFGGTWRTLAMA